MSPVNEAIAYFDPGDDLTCYCTAAVTGRRFVDVSGTKDVASQALSTQGTGGNIPVQHCAAGAKALGVSTYDQPLTGTTAKLPVMRGHKVVPVEAGAAFASGGQSVMSDAVGRAVPWTSAASEANARLGKILNVPTAAGQIAIVALDL